MFYKTFFFKLTYQLNTNKYIGFKFKFYLVYFGYIVRKMCWFSNEMFFKYSVTKLASCNLLKCYDISVVTSLSPTMTDRIKPRGQ